MAGKGISTSRVACKDEEVIYSRCNESTERETSTPGELSTHLIPKASDLDSEDEKLTSPKYPFLGWDWRAGQMSENQQLGPGESSKRTTSCFSTLMDRFVKNINTFDDDVSKGVFNDVQKTMNGTLAELGVSHPIFRQCELTLAGSVGEGTKIGPANEFDYLLVLKLFGDRQSFKLFLRKHFIMIEVTDPEMARNIIDEDMLVEKDGHIYLEKVRRTLISLFVETFEKQLPSGWLLKRTEGKVCLSSIASTLHLECAKYNLEVDIDICLCCPILPADIVETLISQNEKLDDEERKFFKYLKLRNDKKPMNIHAIIAGDMHIHPGLTKTRITSLPLEMEIMATLGQQDGRIQTYCAAKCVAAFFMPKMTELYDCKRCCHGIIRSYHLKNIMFFLNEQYPNECDLSPDLVSWRVLELYNIIRLCVEKTTDSAENEIQSVPTYCTPGSLSIVDMSTFNPFTPEVSCQRERDELFFTEDSHKPSYQLSTSPVLEDSLKLGNPKADDELERWFRHLNKEHWRAYTLLKELYYLLESLSKLKIDK